MSFPEFTNCQTPIDNEDLDEVETRLGIVLPSDLRQHYLKYNGGKPVPSCYPLDGEFYEVRQFCPIKYGDPDLTLEGTYALMSDGVPENLIPFAYDSADNFYCYSVAQTTMHSICYWNDEDYKDPDRGVTVLASTLHEFLKDFVPDPYLDED